MRLDAARLKGCFGSCFRQKLLPEVKVFLHQGLPKNPPLGGFFVLWRSLYRPVDPGSSPLILKTWNFSPLSRSAARSPHSPDLRSRRADRPEGADRAGATERFRGRSTPEQGPEPRDREAERGLCVALPSTPFNHGRDTASPRSRARAAPWITAAAPPPEKQGAMDGQAQLSTSPRIRAKRIFKEKEGAKRKSAKPPQATARLSFAALQDERALRLATSKIT